MILYVRLLLMGEAVWFMTHCAHLVLKSTNTLTGHHHHHHYHHYYYNYYYYYSNEWKCIIRFLCHFNHKACIIVQSIASLAVS